MSGKNILIDTIIILYCLMIVFRLRKLRPFRVIKNFTSKKSSIHQIETVKKSGINIRKFYDNRVTTMHYCEKQLNSSDKEIPKVLRSFNPIYNDQEIFKFKVSSNGTHELTLFEWQINPLTSKNDYLIPQLFRDQLEHKNETTEWTKQTKDFKGKILVSKFYDSVVDGASECKSDGLIDIYDLPPIDTWFYLTTSPQGIKQMYAWIPERFIPLVQKAIDVNCVECLEWYN